MMSVVAHHTVCWKEKIEFVTKGWNQEVAYLQGLRSKTNHEVVTQFADYWNEIFQCKEHLFADIKAPVASMFPPQKKTKLEKKKKNESMQKRSVIVEKENEMK